MCVCVSCTVYMCPCLLNSYVVSLPVISEVSLVSEDSVRATCSSFCAPPSHISFFLCLSPATDAILSPWWPPKWRPLASSILLLFGWGASTVLFFLFPEDTNLELNFFLLLSPSGNLSFLLRVASSPSCYKGESMVTAIATSKPLIMYTVNMDMFLWVLHEIKG